MRFNEIALTGTRKRKLRGDRVNRMVQRQLHRVIEAEGKNTHLEHLEDQIINMGYDGVVQTISYLKGLYNMLDGHTDSGVRVTTKWDGAPAIVAGPDPEDGEFFVGTKGVFARDAKLNKTLDDIEKNHGDVQQKGEVVSKEGLRSKLRPALEELRKLNMPTVMQGDLLFTPDMLKTATIEGEEYITFKPNTITYAVPANSDLAKRIRRAKLGIVFHTTYDGGPTLADTKAAFGADISALTPTADVFFDNADIKDYSGTATLTAEETKLIKKAINDATRYANSIGKKTFDVLNNSAIKNVGIELKAHVNNYIKTQGSFTDDPKKYVDDFVGRMNNKYAGQIEKLKSEKGRASKQQEMEQGLQWINDNRAALESIYGLYLRIMAAKLMFVKKLSTIENIPAFYANEDGSYTVADPEGFVAVDHMGNAVKLVDRLKFSAANFGDKSFG